jgi:N-acetylmuramoyl-L-alanine amidase
MIILLDAGHGIETAGKRSPDESIREYKYCREIRDLIRNKLVEMGLQVEYVSEGDKDIPLRSRCVKVNEICLKYGINNCLLVSIHLNAAGNGKNWTSASGWSSFIYSAASNKSR